MNVTVQSADSSTFYFIRISNQWSISRHLTWNPVSNQKQVLDTEIEEEMTNNKDGTFTFTHVVERPGNITIIVIKYAENLMYCEYFHKPGTLSCQIIHIRKNIGINMIKYILMKRF